MKKKYALVVALAVASCHGRCNFNMFKKKQSARDAGTVVVAPPPPPVVPVDPVAAAGLERVSVTIERPLEESIRGTTATDIAPSLTQVTARLLVWWLDVARGIRKGDRLEIVFQRLPGKEPLIHALKFYSNKNEKEYRAYLFKASDGHFSHYYDQSGTEIEERLEHSPIDDYDQVTSILRDGRRHKGVDFKTPVGTPVKLPFDATLTKKNWNWRGNGNCLEFHDTQGRRIIFLHLAELPRNLVIGRQYKAGEVVAASGNTGHTTAPHLHYQMESPPGKVVDPFKIHEIFHAKLGATQMAAFEATLAKYDKMFTAPPTASATPPPGNDPATGGAGGLPSGGVGAVGAPAGAGGAGGLPGNIVPASTNQ